MQISEVMQGYNFIGIRPRSVVKGNPDMSSDKVLSQLQDALKGLRRAVQVEMGKLVYRERNWYKTTSMDDTEIHQGRSRLETIHRVWSVGHTNVPLDP
jgi:hypothetical protein